MTRENDVRIGAMDVFNNASQIKASGFKAGLKCNEDREDLLMNMISHVQKKPTYYNSQKGTLLSYLTGMAHNMAVTMIRKMNHYPIPMEEDDLVALSDKQGGWDPSVEISREERIAWIRKGIEEMQRKYPSEGVDAFLMFCRDGLKAKEIAKKLGVTEGYVNNAVFKGKKRLRRILSKIDCGGAF